MASEEDIRKYVAMFDAEGEPVYKKEKTQTYFRFGLIFVVLTSLIVNHRLASDPGALYSHFRTALIAGLGVKMWYFTPTFFDVAEDEGLVYSVTDKDEEESDE